MKINYYFLALNLLLNYTSSFGQWTTLDLSSNGVHSFDELCFSDENHGWISYNETFLGNKNHIMYTSNGGQNWESQTINSTNDITDIYFLDNDNGFVTTGSEVFKTSDGGKSWQKNSLDISGDTKIYFKSDDIGYVYNQYGVICKSINGGLDWSKINNGTTEEVRNLHVFSDDNILGVGNSVIVEWENNTWTKRNTSYDQYDLKFINADIGYSCGYEDKILKTIDGGQNWIEETVNSSSSTYLFSMSVVDENNIMAAGDQGNVYRYNGSSWEKENTGFNQIINNITMVNSVNAWATSFGGKLLVYNDSSTLNAINNQEKSHFEYKIIDEFIYIDSNDLNLISVDIHTLEGKSIVNDSGVRNGASYDLSHYRNQILLLKIYNEYKSVSKKIIIKK